MAGRKGGEKTRCSGAWTEAKFTSFVKGNLRRATQKWAPIGQCLKEARTKRGFYMCACCGEEVPSSIPVEGSRRRQKNVHVDHINPVVPVTGWVSWDNCINTLFCELDNLQLVCGECHSTKTKEENEERKKHRALKKAESINDEKL